MPGKSVLRLITRLNVGGPAQQALLLTASLRDEFPTVLAAGAPALEEGELSHPDVTVHRVPLTRPLDPARDARAIGAVYQLVRRTRPALVHTHMAKAGAVGRSVCAVRRAGRPVLVHTFHGHVLAGYFSPAKQRGLVEIERQLARRTDRLIAVSPQVRDALLGLGIGQPAQYVVVPLGVDLTRFLAVAGPAGTLRRRLGLGGDAPLIGAVGRLVPIKNIEFLLDVARRLPDVHVAILGDGESRKGLERMARALGVQSRVHFLGWVTDVATAMSDLDVVVLTSRNEGTPVTLIEALAAARPVVATDVGGVRFVVEHGVSGLVTPLDVDAFAEAVEFALSEGAAMRAMAVAGRAAVGHRFGHHRLVRDIRALYRELVG
ncbi:MAG: glycosyltransferase [Acidimicrobiia bacterium]|nr:glycosyltransferase [Acidimicrobiia bacterium]